MATRMQVRGKSARGQCPFWSSNGEESGQRKIKHEIMKRETESI